MATKTARVAAPKPSAGPPSGTETASLQVSLPQMLDLALGTPEVGSVNLNILHNFLHVVLHQINLRTTKVEYRGEDANRIKNMVTSLKAGPSLHLHEYNIIDGSGRIKQRIQSTDDLTVKVDVYTEETKTVAPGKNAKSGKPAASAPSTARGKGSDSTLNEKMSVSGGPGAKKTRGNKQQVSGGVEGESQSVIFVEPIVDGAAPTALGFKQLEDTVRQLQQHFQALEELADTPEMIDRIKGNSKDPLSDMWHIININKRLDATEQGVDKLATMVQDVMKNDSLDMGNRDVPEQLTVLEQRLNNLESLIKEEGGTYEAETYEGGTKGHENMTHGSLPDERAGNQNVKEDQTSTGIIKDGSMKEEKLAEGEKVAGSESYGGETVTEKRGESSKKPSIGNLGRRSSGVGRSLGADMTEITALKSEMMQVRKDLIDLNEKFNQSIPGDSRGVAVSKDGGIPQEGVEEGAPGSEGPKLSHYLEEVHNMEAMLGDAMRELQDRIQQLEKDVGFVLEQVNSGPMAGVDPESSQGFGELVSKIQGIQADMENVNQTANRLLDDKESREINANALLEQIELLKTIKADKEDLEDALADKADAQAVNRKVSYVQFDAACDDLARGLEDAISKLTQQETIWQQALDEVQQEIEGKLDRIEISPLKEFVNNKLKMLQDKLKALSEMRRDTEAAATKKMLRDVQCLSCDKNVVMKMQEGATYHAEAMPCTKSMKPYLTYELDQVRKQQRRLPHGRNMIQFEAAMQEESKKVKATKDDTFGKSPRDHLCNRYCGGSHTVTTPQQRVMRMGHFLTQWGPEAIQLTEGVIRGTDGQMYRSRGMSGKPDVYRPCGDDGIEQPSSARTLVPAEPESLSSRRAGSQRKISLPSQRRLSARKIVTPTEEAPPQDPIPEETASSPKAENGHEEPEESGQEHSAHLHAPAGEEVARTDQVQPDEEPETGEGEEQ